MKAARALGVLGVVQLLLVGIYLAVEAGREAAAPFAVEALDEALPALAVTRGEQPLALPSEPHLVHFWATWCGPCEVELPALLGAVEATGVPLLAVTEEPWAVVERHFGEDVPQGIVRDPSGGAAEAWGVSGLPDTFVVREGRVVGRMGGPREWGSDEARDFLDELRRTR